MTGNGNRYAETWSYGRRLTGLSSGSEAFSYSYNADGIRTAKTVNGVKHTYALSGTTILNEEWTENGVQHLMMYVYDANGSPVGMVYRNSTMAANATEEYLFVKNIQGDILHVYNSAGKKLVSYVYDAWGNIISTTYSNGGGTSAARFNPFTYRGYYRDSETGMYYLNSRYYNPKMGRFISADSEIHPVEFSGCNLFEYCANNPVVYYDPYGDCFIWSIDIMFDQTIIIDQPISVPEISIPNIPSIPYIDTIVLPDQLVDCPYIAVDKAEDSDNVKGKRRNGNLASARKRFSSRKEAYEAAKHAGHGKEPRLDPPSDNRPPHYHPTVDKTVRYAKKTVNTHDHYYFPKSQYSIPIIDFEQLLDYYFGNLEIVYYLE